jgi:hypothetical protein
MEFSLRMADFPSRDGDPLTLGHLNYSLVEKSWRQIAAVAALKSRQWNTQNSWMANDEAHAPREKTVEIEAGTCCCYWRICVMMLTNLWQSLVVGCSRSIVGLDLRRRLRPQNLRESSECFESYELIAEAQSVEMVFDLSAVAQVLGLAPLY